MEVEFNASAHFSRENEKIANETLTLLLNDEDSAIKVQNIEAAYWTLLLAEPIGPRWHILKTRHLLIFYKVYNWMATALFKISQVRPREEREQLLASIKRPEPKNIKYPITFSINDDKIHIIPMSEDEIYNWPKFRALACAHFTNFEHRVWLFWCIVRSFLMQQKYDAEGLVYRKLDIQEASLIMVKPLSAKEYKIRPLFALFFPQKPVKMITMTSDSFSALC